MSFCQDRAGRSCGGNTMWQAPHSLTHGRIGDRRQVGAFLGHGRKDRCGQGRGEEQCQAIHGRPHLLDR